MVLQPHHAYHCYSTRARLILLLLRVLRYAAAFAACAAIFAYLKISAFILAIAGVLLALFLVRGAARRKYATICISEAELQFSGGMLLRMTDHVPLANIRYALLRQSRIDRAFGITRLLIYPIKKKFGESTASYAAMQRLKGAYECVLPDPQAQQLANELRAKDIEVHAD